MPEYSFCETAWATADSPWHIRPLTSVGRRLGGGADTPALCSIRVAWDRERPVEDGVYGFGICVRCKTEYGQITGGPQ